MKDFPKPSITTVVEHYGGRAVGTDFGGWRRVACPMHDDKIPSASLNEDYCHFTCFVCDFSGDAVDLIERITGARPVDAIEIAKGLERATASYEAQMDHPTASYLMARGIEKETALGCRLGVVSDPLPGHERFVGMLSIPYITPAGVVAMKFRRIDGGQPKYDSPSGQHARLYNVAALHSSSDTIAVCEGELDACVCTFSVGVPAVGTPGGTWLEHWSRCFADFENILIVADNDIREGESPGMKRAKKLQGELKGSRVVVPPAGMDLNEWVLSVGAEAVRGKML